MSENIVITGAARTPMGGFQGSLSGATAAELGAAAVRAAVERSGVGPDDVDEVILGCVLPAGQGQAPARQAALGGGLPLATGCTTINKMCGSGMKATMLAHDLLRAGITLSDDVVVVNKETSNARAEETLADCNTIVAVQTIFRWPFLIRYAYLVCG